MKWQRRILGVLGVLVCIMALVYISLPVGHIPLYDANLVRLAETDLQAYCSGNTIMKTGGNPDANLASECRTSKAGQYSNTYNLKNVQNLFCQAVLDAGWTGTMTDCLGILTDNEYWPTYDGSISNQWNRARPYPGRFVPLSGGTRGSDTSRTGGHNGSTRDNAPQRPY